MLISCIIRFVPGDGLLPSKGPRYKPQALQTLGRIRAKFNRMLVSGRLNSMLVFHNWPGLPTITRRRASLLEQASNQNVQQLGPGILVLSNTRKAMDLGKVIPFNGIVRMYLITRYKHAAMLDLSQNQAMLSDVTSMGFGPDQFGIIKQLSSDMYQIDPVALIPKEHHQLLQQVYGENWQSEVAGKFKIIENESYINGATRFSGLVAGVRELENASGIASWIPFGHKKLTPNDFEELHQDIMTRGKYTQRSGILCSSFCAISIATTLVELDKQIQEDIRSSQVKTGQKHALNIVTIPFGKHEDLYKMHPERLLEVLKSYNCVTPAQPKVLEN